MIGDGHLKLTTDKSTGNGVHQLVLLGVEGNDPREDGLASELAFRVFRHQARPHFDLLTDLVNEEEEFRKGVRECTSTWI